jgi:hypothetical protein
LKDLAAEIDLTHEAFYRAFVGFGSKAEELTASTTGLLHPWELTISQMLRLGGSGPQAGISSILTVRTLGRCKPVAQSLTKAAVPDAI